MIGAVVVSYNPDEQILRTLESLREQVDYLLLLDNGSEHGVSFIERAIKICDNVKLLGANVGVARAYNIGCDLLGSLDCGYVVISDQDTFYQANCVPNLVRIAFEYEEVIVVPNVFDSRKMAWKKFERFGALRFQRSELCDETEEVSIAISSGSLISLSTYKLVGVFLEDLFIDYVDTEFCMRAGRSGIPIVAVKSAVIEHSLGYSTASHLCGMTFYPKNYSEFRRRYIYRNRVICWSKFYGLGYFAWDLCAMAKDLFCLIAFEQRKFSKLYASLRGCLSGINYLINRKSQ